MKEMKELEQKSGLLKDTKPQKEKFSLSQCGQQAPSPEKRPAGQKWFQSTYTQNWKAESVQAEARNLN